MPCQPGFVCDYNPVDPFRQVIVRDGHCSAFSPGRQTHRFASIRLEESPSTSIVEPADAGSPVTGGLAG